VIAAAGGNSQAGGLSPLVQSYQDGFNFNRPYGKPVPRPDAAFTNGAFGPMLPVAPAPIDAPNEQTGRPDPRRFQYPVGWNLPVGQPGMEGIKLAPFGTLRSLADMYSVARSCVDKRIGEILGLEWDIVPTDEAEHAMRGDAEKRAEWEKRRAEVREFFMHPDSDRAKYPTMSVWLAALLEDVFVLDAVALHLRPPRVKNRGPFNSNLASLDLLDGSTIRPLLDMSGATPAPPSVAFQQYIWGVPRVDLTQVMLGTDIEGMADGLVQEFSSDQLMYLRFRPRNWTPYGFSPVEEALLPINIGLARQQYQWDYYQDGSIPGQFIVPGPDIATPQQIRQLQDALNAMAGDIGAKHRIIVLPPGSKADPQKTAPLADQFDEWIISQVAMPFQLTPFDLGVTPRVSAIQTPAESKQIQNINSSQGSSTRLEPLCTWLKQVLFDYVIKGVFGQQDMEWSWGLTKEGEDAETEVGLHLQKVQNALESVDEARIALGDTPWGLPETSIPLVWTPTGPIPLAQAGQALANPQAHPGVINPNDHPQNGQPGDHSVDEHGEPTTPAHEAAEANAKPSKPASGSPSKTVQPDRQEKALRTELQILGRHLRKGRDLATFRCDAIPQAALAAAEPHLQKGMVGDAVAAVGDAARAWWAQQRRDHVLAALADWVSREVGQIVRNWRAGHTAQPTAVDQAVDVMRTGYNDAMIAGSRHANDDHDAQVLDFRQAAAQRAEGQRGYVMRLLTAGTTALDVGTLNSRFQQYGSTLTGAYNEAYGRTVEATGDDYEIIWHLGQTEHCGLCLDRAGRSFTFEDLPGWPGDGEFGGPICEGGPNCGCSLEFRERHEPVSVIGTNTQRPDSVGYYQQQRSDIDQARQEARENRQRFLETIPGSAAARAAQRDTVRQQLADIANATIRAAGGYSGITIEPADIPADLVPQIIARAVKYGVNQPVDGGAVTKAEMSAKDFEDTERLMRYWSHGEGAAKIRWGEPHDFYRCEAHLAKYVPDPDELKGLCANLHHRALGVWPGQEDGGKAADPDMAKWDPLQPSPKDGSIPLHGYQVGIAGHTMKVVDGHVPTADEINAMSEQELAGHYKRWLRENAAYFDDPNMHVGGWHDPVDHRVHFDLSENVAGKQEAIRLGRERNQVSIFDNEAAARGDWDHAFIDTGGSGD
jgi:hypothetical protein